LYPFHSGGGYTSSTGKKLKLSIIGLLDKKMQLQKDTVKLFPSPTPSARPNMDVCVMAAKIVYEREEVATDVINNVWNSQWTKGGEVKVGRALEGAQMPYIFSSSSCGRLDFRSLPSANLMASFVHVRLENYAKCHSRILVLCKRPRVQ
jgi:hypothetical protein